MDSGQASETMTDGNRTSTQTGKRKRGRPPGTAAEKSRKQAPRFEESDSDQSFTNESSGFPASKHSQKYQEALKAYEKNSGLSHQLLRRLAALPVLQQQSQQEPILQQVMDISRKLMMTELELVVWAIHLTRTQEIQAFPLLISLLVSAFYVKSTLGGDISSVQIVLERQNSGFAANLDRWKLLNPRESMEFSLGEVSKKWKEMKRPVSEEDMQVINYNYYIDDILSAGIAPVDQFTTSNYTRRDWLDDTPIRPIPPKPTPPPLTPAYEPVLAKECEDFPYPQLQWFEQVPVSPGLLFFNFPSPGVSALLQPMEEQYDPQTHYPGQPSSHYEGL